MRRGMTGSKPSRDEASQKLECGLTEAAHRLAHADLVIGADTAPLHIAGALERPTWALLPPNPDWRWGLSGERTPWCPNVRLFRAVKPRAWGVWWRK